MHAVAQPVVQLSDLWSPMEELWPGVGMTAAWNLVMVAASFLCLIFLNREPPTSLLPLCPPPVRPMLTLVQVVMQSSDLCLDVKGRWLG